MYTFTFFFNDTAATEIYTFPYTTLFRSSTVFCAVSAVIAVMPCTPQAAKALRSAWMPAPPPESDPAIESTAGTGLRGMFARSGEHTSEIQARHYLVCRLLLGKKQIRR